MPQPKIYAAVLNHFGSLSDLAATLGATVVDETRPDGSGGFRSHGAARA